MFTFEISLEALVNTIIKQHIYGIIKKPWPLWSNVKKLQQGGCSKNMYGCTI